MASPSMTEDSMEQSSRFPIAPAPWKNVCESYWFFMNGLKDLPEGAYGPLESSAGPVPEFKGGLASVMIVRYTSSPVGPYDELAFSPGEAVNPFGKPYMSVSRIYVSTEASVYNGRRNWNIPKHLARFSFTPIDSSPSSPIKIQVYPPTPSTAPPFFSAIITPVASFLPSIPFSTTYSPISMLIVQPPLPSSPSDDATVGTTVWKSILPKFTGKIRFFRGTPGGEEDLGEEYADGVHFPRFKPWKVGITWVPGTILDFPEAGEVSGGEDSAKNK